MGGAEAVPSAASPETLGVCRMHRLQGAHGIEAGLQGHVGLEGLRLYHLSPPGLKW